MISADLVYGLSEAFLKAGYDDPVATPDLHMEMWEDACSDEQYVAFAAPRSHAKSTAMTGAYLLAEMLVRRSQFALLVSDTEGQAVEFLGDIRAVLEENKELRDYFSVKKIVKSTDTNLICQFTHGEMFRITVKGSEQKVRGIKWRNKRPDLIVGDDLENDEIVMNPDRREKFRKWFMNALLPCGSKHCRVRIVGTILHLDAMLQRLMDDPTWKTRLYASCEVIPDPEAPDGS